MIFQKCVLKNIRKSAILLFLLQVNCNDLYFCKASCKEAFCSVYFDLVVSEQKTGQEVSHVVLVSVGQSQVSLNMTLVVPKETFVTAMFDKQTSR